MQCVLKNYYYLKEFRIHIHKEKTHAKQLFYACLYEKIFRLLIKILENILYKKNHSAF